MHDTTTTMHCHLPRIIIQVISARRDIKVGIGVSGSDRVHGAGVTRLHRATATRPASALVLRLQHHQHVHAHIHMSPGGNFSGARAQFSQMTFKTIERRVQTTTDLSRSLPCFNPIRAILRCTLWSGPTGTKILYDH